MPTDEDLQELLDRARIADTIYAYCDYADRADIDGVVALFTEDGVVNLGGGALHRGPEELREMFADRFALYSVTSFHSSGIRIAEYDGQRASVMSYLYGIHDAPEMDRRMHLWGRFDDAMVKQDGTWRFQARHLRVAALSHTSSQEVPERFSRIERVPLPGD